MLPLVELLVYLEEPEPRSCLVAKVLERLGLGRPLVAAAAAKNKRA